METQSTLGVLYVLFLDKTLSVWLKKGNSDLA